MLVKGCLYVYKDKNFSISLSSLVYLTIILVKRSVMPIKVPQTPTKIM